MVSLWDMLRFYADKFVKVLNLLRIVEGLMEQQESQLRELDTLDFVGARVNDLLGQLKDLNLPVSAKTADDLHFSLTHTPPTNVPVCGENLTNN